MAYAYRLIGEGDLELLAQANGSSQRNQLGSFSGDSVPYPPLQTKDDIQVSRFFQREF